MKLGARHRVACAAWPSRRSRDFSNRFPVCGVLDKQQSYRRATSMKFGSLAVAALGFLLTVSHAQSWLEMQTPHYSVFYEAGYEKDAVFMRQWMDRTEQLMKSKYGVTPEDYRTSLYLYTNP